VWAVQVHVLWLNSSVRAKLWRNCGECDLFKLLCLKKNKSQNYMLSLSLSLSLSLTLRLSKNCISRDGVECLIEALKINCSVKEVW